MIGAPSPYHSVRRLRLHAAKAALKPETSTNVFSGEYIESGFGVSQSLLQLLNVVLITTTDSRKVILNILFMSSVLLRLSYNVRLMPKLKVIGTGVWLLGNVLIPAPWYSGSKNFHGENTAAFTILI